MYSYAPTPEAGTCSGDCSSCLGKRRSPLALQELHLPSLEAHGPTEEEIYGIFLKHATPGLEQEFRDVYKRIHGGPFLDGS